MGTRFFHATPTPRSIGADALGNRKSAGMSAFSLRQEVGPVEKKQKNSLKVKERRGNVTENKALHFLEGGQSGNVVDSKGVTLIERECC
jgi:hypothetical protein